MLEGLRYDRETGHKTVTIRGQSKAEMRCQGLKDLIDDVLAGDLADRCIIQKTTTLVNINIPYNTTLTLMTHFIGVLSLMHI